MQSKACDDLLLLRLSRMLMLLALPMLLNTRIDRPVLRGIHCTGKTTPLNDRPCHDSSILWPSHYWESTVNISGSASFDFAHQSWSMVSILAFCGRKTPPVLQWEVILRWIYPITRQNGAASFIRNPFEARVGDGPIFNNQSSKSHTMSSPSSKVTGLYNICFILI